jgi:hypothetical protein
MSYRRDFRRYLQFSRDRNARELSGTRHECREDNGDAPGRLLLLDTIRLILAACAGPVRAVRVDRAVALRDLTRSVTTTGDLRRATRSVLLEQACTTPSAIAPRSSLPGSSQVEGEQRWGEVAGSDSSRGEKAWTQRSAM